MPRIKQTLTAFISYSTIDKHVAAQVKEVLSEFDIDAFLAHEDINVSEQWEKRIKEELGLCDIFIPILSESFRKSDWAPQELGIASQRHNVLPIPLCLDQTIPFGFLHHVQGKKVAPDSSIFNLLATALIEKYQKRTMATLLTLLPKIKGFRYAESVLDVFEPYFRRMNVSQVNQFARAAVGNNQIWSASKCRTELLPKFVRLNRKKIDPEILRALQYQIENDDWYKPEVSGA